MSDTGWSRSGEMGVDMSLLDTWPLTTCILLSVVATVMILRFWTQLGRRTPTGFVARLVCLVLYGSITLAAATLALNLKYRWYDL